MTLKGDQFLAGDADDDAPFVRVSLSCRDLLWLKNALIEALLMLTKGDNYTLNGTADALTCADYGAEIFASFRIGVADMPIGVQVDWFGTIENAPEEWLYCDGSVYTRAEYADLYDVINPALIIDEDTFRVPDLRAHSVVGIGTYDYGDDYLVTVDTMERLGLPQNYPEHYHEIPTEVVALQDGATNRRILKDSFSGAEALATTATGSTDPRENYHPVFGLFKFIVAL